MPQLQINQGPQDALLYDNSRSYFTNVGYVRTSNFQLELRDVDSQNTANLGTTVQFVIPKAADLLGPCDLMVDLATATGGAAADTYAAWVESVGFAMIERITFSVGSHDVETISGDQLNIINELMKTDDARMGNKQIGKTGRAPVEFQVPKDDVGDYDTPQSTFDAIASPNATETSTYETAKAAQQNAAVPYADEGDTTRLIYNGSNYIKGKKLIVPLGLFFTKHPSQYFPLAAIAGANDIRIAIKFRTLNELCVLGGTDYYMDGASKASNSVIGAPGPVATAVYPTFPSAGPIDKCRLRCHYVHVTGPEATTLMNKEHVRLLKLWQVNSRPISIKARAQDPGKLVDIDLSFLHPVQELIITIRKSSEMTSSSNPATSADATDQAGTGKNYFAYHGSGKDPNIESLENRALLDGGGLGSGIDAANKHSYLTVQNFKLTLNGQERHPSLASSGLDREYLMNRLMPMLHSNSSHTFSDLTQATVGDAQDFSWHHLGNMLDRKEIYVYPFALNPESANPSGAVNFSKVSHAKLTIEGLCSATDDYQVDVYGVHYNWLQIKDGRALTSFA